MNITTTRKLLTAEWSADVDAVEAGIRRFASNRTPRHDCHIAFFEIPFDKELHVNVTHSHQTREVTGWAGPASGPEGFVHNRRFDEQPPERIVRQIRAMVFAAPV
jgi:hypothetical protein